MQRTVQTLNGKLENPRLLKGCLITPDQTQCDIHKIVRFPWCTGRALSIQDDFWLCQNPSPCFPTAKYTHLKLTAFPEHIYIIILHYINLNAIAGSWTVVGWTLSPLVSKHPKYWGTSWMLFLCWHQFVNTKISYSIYSVYFSLVHIKNFGKNEDRNLTTDK